MKYAVVRGTPPRFAALPNAWSACIASGMTTAGLVIRGSRVDVAVAMLLFISLSDRWISVYPYDPPDRRDVTAVSARCPTPLISSGAEILIVLRYRAPPFLNPERSRVARRAHQVTSAGLRGSSAMKPRDGTYEG